MRGVVFVDGAPQVLAPGETREVGDVVLTLDDDAPDAAAAAAAPDAAALVGTNRSLRVAVGGAELRTFAWDTRRIAVGGLLNVNLRIPDDGSAVGGLCADRIDPANTAPAPLAAAGTVWRNVTDRLGDLCSLKAALQEDAPIDWEPDVPARRRCEQTGTDPAKAVKACERFAGVPGASVRRARRISASSAAPISSTCRRTS